MLNPGDLLLERDRRDLDLPEEVEDLSDLPAFHPDRAWVALDKYVLSSDRFSTVALSVEEKS